MSIKTTEQINKINDAWKDVEKHLGGSFKLFEDQCMPKVKSRIAIAASQNDTSLTYDEKMLMEDIGSDAGCSNLLIMKSVAHILRAEGYKFRSEGIDLTIIWG